MKGKSLVEIGAIPTLEFEKCSLRVKESVRCVRRSNNVDSNNLNWNGYLLFLDKGLQYCANLI